jgi:hypothetical protein
MATLGLARALAAHGYAESDCLAALEECGGDAGAAAKKLIARFGKPVAAKPPEAPKASPPAVAAPASGDKRDSLDAPPSSARRSSRGAAGAMQAEDQQGAATAAPAQAAGEVGVEEAEEAEEDEEEEEEEEALRPQQQQGLALLSLPRLEAACGEVCRLAAELLPAPAVAATAASAPPAALSAAASSSASKALRILSTMLRACVGPPTSPGLPTPAPPQSSALLRELPLPASRALLTALHAFALPMHSGHCLLPNPALPPSGPGAAAAAAAALWAPGWAEGLAASLRCLEAGECAVMLMCAPGVDGRLLQEEVLGSIVEALRTVITRNVTPCFDAQDPAWKEAARRAQQQQQHSTGGGGGGGGGLQREKARKKRGADGGAGRKKRRSTGGGRGGGGEEEEEEEEEEEGEEGEEAEEG